VKDLAAELLRVRAAREHMPGIQYPQDTAWQKSSRRSFRTRRRRTSSRRSRRSSATCMPKPMDRLVCGDVGFGKTELAIRAAFKACEFGKQVAVLVPTTVLAEQHERTFRLALRAIHSASRACQRFKTDKEQNQERSLAMRFRAGRWMWSSARTACSQTTCTSRISGW
jgi:transcription-repair coupling factor (superfamily II helicase)